jgi:4-amino-4-deoxy-L-arabinose transferase-like glycosyltransferase
VPSLLAAMAASIAAWWLALAFLSPRGALVAGWLTAASGIVGLFARLATPDAILLAAATFSAGALARAWTAPADKRIDGEAAVFWGAQGIAILVSGWVAPAIALAACAILSLARGSARWVAGLRPAVGLIAVLLIISPWLVLVALTLLQSAGGGPNADFLALIGVPYAVDGPPGTYLLLLPLIVGPAASFLFLGFRWLLDNVRLPAVTFALAWGGPVWLLAELLPAKTPQNVLPAVPAAVLLAAVAIDAGAARIRGRVSWFYSLGPLVWPPLGLVLLTAAFIQLEGRWPHVAIAAFGGAAILGPMTWRRIQLGETVLAVVFSVVTVALIYLGFFGVFVPGLSAIRVSERLAALVATAAPCPDPAIAATGYPEESLVFALGAGTRLVDARGAAEFLDTAGCRVALVDARQIPAFRHRAEDLGLVLRDDGNLRGFNMGKMTEANVHLFSVAAAE